MANARTIHMHGHEVAAKATVMVACPGCSSTKGHELVKLPRVFVCGHCSGLVGTCYLGESLGLVRDTFGAGNVPASRWVYFDFTTLGSAGVGRRHGWFDPQTRFLTQIG